MALEKHAQSLARWRILLVKSMPSSSGGIQRVGIPKGNYLAWEIDWARRRIAGPGRGHPEVWARNPSSIRRATRKWHWTPAATLKKAGVRWIPKVEKPGRSRDSAGYVILTRRAMTDLDIELANAHQLWIGQRRAPVSSARSSSQTLRSRGVKEHKLVAVKKYGSLPLGFVVRHRNGKKDDNRPSNLLIGTPRDNTQDHVRVIRELMYWRERALRAEGVSDIPAALSQPPHSQKI
jgi:HNH endonuclease